MCTAITFQTKDHYFGRNLDLEHHYRETVTITPRNYTFTLRNGQKLTEHYAMIGMATVTGEYPLYYDATNEYGLSMAALNFPDNAVYKEKSSDKCNITPFELILWLLSTCKTVEQAQEQLQNLNLWKHAFSKTLPLTPLHWILADQTHCLVMEPMADGLHIHPNPTGVLTNNPPFPYHMHHLNHYLQLTPNVPENHIAPDISLSPYSRGMGAMGLPGDLSSASRFVRAVFTKQHARIGSSEAQSITQFFHILGSVEQQEGCVRLPEGDEKTVYSSCCNTGKGIYYYKTYENSQITAVHMHKEDLDGTALIRFPLRMEQTIHMEN